MLQLQLLFSKLQLSKSMSIKTVGITSSFGWGLSEVFQQQDLNEFSSVLFESIQHAVMSTDLHSMIRDTFYGVLSNYLNCMNCGTGRDHDEDAKGFNLYILDSRNPEDIDTIEQCFRRYFRPELLSEGNLLRCYSCNSKQPALKGLLVKKLALILMLNIQRFVFDFETIQLSKVYTKVRFPQIPNMNPYINGTTTS